MHHRIRNERVEEVDYHHASSDSVLYALALDAQQGPAFRGAGERNSDNPNCTESSKCVKVMISADGCLSK